MVKGRLIVWNLLASKQLRKIYHHILTESYQNAEMVKSGITKAVDSLAGNPEKYPPDKFRMKNTGQHRAFELFSLRISYRYNEKEVRILRLRHVKQEPKIH